MSDILNTLVDSIADEVIKKIEAKQLESPKADVVGLSTNVVKIMTYLGIEDRSLEEIVLDIQMNGPSERMTKASVGTHINSFVEDMDWEDLFTSIDAYAIYRHLRGEIRDGVSEEIRSGRMDIDLSDYFDEDIDDLKDGFLSKEQLHCGLSQSIKRMDELAERSDLPKVYENIKDLLLNLRKQI